MENFPIPWCNWCRLCAKEDSKNNVNIHLKELLEPLKAGQDVKLTLKEALAKYFWVQSLCDDVLPKHLCLDCYSMISSITLFNERVERVQQMYKFLVENPMDDSCDLKSIREKFDVSESQGGQWCHTLEETKETSRCCKEYDCHPVCIKQESCNADSNHLKYEENYEVEDECCGPEEALCDEKSLKSREEVEDPFHAMSENGENEHEASSDEEGQSRTVESTNIETSTRNKENIKSKTSKHKGMRCNLNTTKCKKKKIMSEDFTLDTSCLECGQKFQRFSVYCQHVKETHNIDSVEKQWKCPLCRRTLKSWYNFERHMRIHMPLETRETFKCPECDNRYTSSAQLDAHINYKHKNEKPFICEECGICVRTNSNLRQHMLIHTDNAPFECEICKKSFKNNSRLKIHMDIHSPNKHVCAICGLQLNSRATLNRHFLVHSDEMQHKCDYCGRAFKRAKALKNHLILHTGLKPYSCDFCDRTFANGSNCRSHMKKMHPDELASLEATGIKTHTKNIPKLETLKAVTKAADNLTPVVTKFSGCFAFGKKPRASAESRKTSKYLRNAKRLNAIQAKEKSTSSTDFRQPPLDGNTCLSGTDPLNIPEPIVNVSAATSIPNFDNIYQHLMKQNPHEQHIKRPPVSPSAAENQNTSLPQFYNHIQQSKTTNASSNTLAVSQSSPESHSSSMTPNPKIDDHSNPLPQTPYYVAMRQASSLHPDTFL